MKDIYLVAIQLYEEAVQAGAPRDVCQCCGAHVAEGVKGCWELYTQLGVRDYTDAAYGASAFYGVDAHALQHPEIHGRKNNAAHLLHLHWIFTRGAYEHAGTVPRWWQQYLDHSDIPLLDPPPLGARGEITVVDVAAAPSPSERAALMQPWAWAVYQAWQGHHAWAGRALAGILT